jgi:UDP-glucuronate decarboxylase
MKENKNYKKVKLPQKKILITGSSGFIGLNLTKHLLKLSNKNKIIGVDKIKPNIEFNDNFKFIKKNLLKFNNSFLKKHKFDYIIHLAGIPSPTYYKENPLGTVTLNESLTKILLAKSLKDKARFVYFSSSEIYGNPDKKNIPTKETYQGLVSPISDRSCYDESKRMGETLTYIYRNKYNLNSKIIRPFNFYGEGMKKNDKRVIPQFFLQALANKKIKVFSNGKQTRTYCHIDDAIEMIIAIIFFGKDFVYNVGNDKNEMSANQLAKKILKITGSFSSISNIKYPSNYPSDEPQRRSPNIDKFKKEFGFSPKIKIDDGLKTFFDYAKKTF